MTGSELAAVIVAITSVVAVVLLVIAIIALVRTLRSMRETVEALRQEAVPAVVEMRSTVQAANAELARVDVLLDRAESVSATVDSASRLTYLAVSNPVIKTMAFAAGTGRAARRLRRGS
jgi:uncharacterized protein YoxC